MLVPNIIAGNFLIVECRRWSVDEHPDGVGIENGDNYFHVAVGGYVCREIHLSANGEFILTGR